MLGDVLEQVNRFEKLDPEREYRLLGVKWYAQGVFEREPKFGKVIAAKQLNRVEEGDFVYNRLFAWKGSFAVVGDGHAGGYVSGEFPVFRAKPDAILAEFLYRHFSRPQVWRLIEHHSTGTTNVSRNRWREEQFLSWSISLPPLSDQRRIVTTLSVVDSAIRSNAEVMSFTQELKELIAHELLVYGLPGRHTRFKESPVGPVPADWEIVRLGEVACVENGATPSKARSDYWDGGTVAWLPTGKVNDRLISSANQFITHLALEECSVSLLPPGTILVAMIGQGKTRGMVAYLDIEACINQNFAAIKPSDRLDSWFLFHLLDAHYVALRESGRGSNQSALNCQIVKSFPIPLPSMHEQREIAQLLSGASSLLESSFATVERLQELRSRLVTRLIAGHK
jgi:type I restriction enzyme S subunit